MGDLATIATNTLAPDLVHKLLMGNSGSSLVKKLKGERARNLLASEAATGIYVNLDRVKQKLGSLGGGGLLGDLLRFPKELTLELSLFDRGLIGDLEIAPSRRKWGGRCCCADGTRSGSGGRQKQQEVRPSGQSGS